MTRVLAKELGPRKIRVNGINPGVVETEGAHAAGVIGSDFEKQSVARTPLGHLGCQLKPWLRLGNDAAGIIVTTASIEKGRVFQGPHHEPNNWL